MVPAIPATANKHQARHAPHDKVSTGTFPAWMRNLWPIGCLNVTTDQALQNLQSGHGKTAAFGAVFVRDEANVEKGLGGRRSDGSLHIR
jgi:hypothetical protein